MAPVVDVAAQETPGGYFESGAWHGQAWTGVDTAGLATVTPPNFAALAPQSPFCFEGTVRADPPSTPTATDGYQGVALLGFNINQELVGPVAGQPAPILERVPTERGVAVNFSRNSPPAGSTVTLAPVIRIQIQNLAGTTWCADLPTVNGKGFIAYEAGGTDPNFRTECWLAATGTTSRPYAREPISNVILVVPGGGIAGQDFYYNACVAGFADANSADDAPDNISLGDGILTGTISGEAEKIKLTGKDGNSYIINNNAWGDNSSDGSQQLRYTGNSFEILRQTAGQGANSSPASFPSIYIGNNGATTGVNGATTLGEDKLPIQVSAITSIPTTFNHSGPLGDNNATYDVWFAPNGTPSAHGTAQAAFLMVWTHRPAGRSPIGNNAGRTNLTINGVTGAWDLWVGPRGGGGPDANLPVLSYVSVNPATVRNFTFDLSAFIRDAVGRNLGLTNGMFLTDVFAGFEIWGGGTGLRVDEFSAVINP